MEIEKKEKHRYFSHWKTGGRKTTHKKEIQKEKAPVFLAVANKREEERQKARKRKEKHQYFSH